MANFLDSKLSKGEHRTTRSVHPEKSVSRSPSVEGQADCGELVRRNLICKITADENLRLVRSDTTLCAELLNGLLDKRKIAYSLALANARPDPDFRYFSNANARSSSVNVT